MHHCINPRNRDSALVAYIHLGKSGSIIFMYFHLHYVRFGHYAYLCYVPFGHFTKESQRSHFLSRGPPEDTQSVQLLSWFLLQFWFRRLKLWPSKPTIVTGLLVCPHRHSPTFTDHKAIQSFHCNLGSHESHQFNKWFRNLLWDNPCNISTNIVCVSIASHH